MLDNFKGFFTERDIGQIALQLLQGVQYLHQQGIFLGHLKPQNVLVYEGLEIQPQQIKVKISDIGLNAIINICHENLRYEVSGVDRLFLAPELYRSKA